METENLKRLFKIGGLPGMLKGKPDEYPMDILHVYSIVPTERLRKDQFGMLPFEKIKLHITEEDNWEDAFTILSVRLYERHGYTFNYETLIEVLKSFQETNLLADDIITFWYRTDREFPVFLEGNQNTLIFCPYAKGAEPPSLVIDREMNWRSNE